MKEDKYSAVIGVISFNYQKAGFPEIKKIAQEWAKDPNFYNLIIRKTNGSDFGLQFIYAEKGDYTDFEENYLLKYKDKYNLSWEIAYLEDKTIDEIREHIVIYKIPEELN